MREFLDGLKELARIEQLLVKNGLNSMKLECTMRILQQLQVMRYKYRSPLVPFTSVDKTHQMRPVNGEYDGHIPQCSVSRCGFACCDVGTSGLNTIKLTKGELDKTKLSTTHLTVIENLGDSGCRATCNNGCENGKGCAPDTGRNNLSGYKPNDCDDYPWFRNLNIGKIEMWISDEKCPLPATAKLTHLPGVLEHFRRDVETDSNSTRSYEGAIGEMVDYKKFDPIDLEKLDPDDIKIIFEAGVHHAITKEWRTISVLTDDSPESDIQEYERRLRKKMEQALKIVHLRDGIRYSHLQY